MGATLSVNTTEERVRIMEGWQNGYKPTLYFLEGNDGIDEQVTFLEQQWPGERSNWNAI